MTITLEFQGIAKDTQETPTVLRDVVIGDLTPLEYYRGSHQALSKIQEAVESFFGAFLEHGWTYRPVWVQDDF